jgi:hypothetical protein
MGKISCAQRHPYTPDKGLFNPENGNFQAHPYEIVDTVSVLVPAKIRAQMARLSYLAGLLQEWRRGAETEARRTFMNLSTLGTFEREDRCHIFTITPLPKPSVLCRAAKSSDSCFSTLILFHAYPARVGEADPVPCPNLISTCTNITFPQARHRMRYGCPRPDNPLLQGLRMESVL